VQEPTRHSTKIFRMKSRGTLADATVFAAYKVVLVEEANMAYSQVDGQFAWKNNHVYCRLEWAFVSNVDRYALIVGREYDDIHTGWENDMILTWARSSASLISSRCALASLPTRM
jgi:hypothetical protein